MEITIMIKDDKGEEQQRKKKDNQDKPMEVDLENIPE